MSLEEQQKKHISLVNRKVDKNLDNFHCASTKSNVGTVTETKYRHCSRLKKNNVKFEFQILKIVILSLINATVF